MKFFKNLSITYNIDIEIDCLGKVVKFLFNNIISYIMIKKICWLFFKPYYD